MEGWNPIAHGTGYILLVNKHCTQVSKVKKKFFLTLAPLKYYPPLPSAGGKEGISSVSTRLIRRAGYDQVTKVHIVFEIH